MTKLEPINQTQLFGLNNFLNDLVDLYEKNKLPNKILLSGQKGYMNLKTRKSRIEGEKSKRIKGIFKPTNK